MAHSTILEYLLASFSPGQGRGDTEPARSAGVDATDTDPPESEHSLSS